MALIALTPRFWLYWNIYVILYNICLIHMLYNIPRAYFKTIRYTLNPPTYNTSARVLNPPPIQVNATQINGYSRLRSKSTTIRHLHPSKGRDSSWALPSNAPGWIASVDLPLAWSGDRRLRLVLGASLHASRMSRDRWIITRQTSARSGHSANFNLGFRAVAKFDYKNPSLQKA